MRKVIDGKLYDTETAEELHSYSNGLGRFDVGYVEESLYRTTNGSYFLTGAGGANSTYREPVGNNAWGAGEGVIPVDGRTGGRLLA